MVLLKIHAFVDFNKIYEQLNISSLKLLFNSFHKKAIDV